MSRNGVPRWGEGRGVRNAIYMILLTKAFFYDHFLVFSKKNMPTARAFFGDSKTSKNCSDFRPSYFYLYTPIPTRRERSEVYIWQRGQKTRRSRTQARHNKVGKRDERPWRFRTAPVRDGRGREACDVLLRAS